MDIYERLRAMLDTHPSGCPSSPEVFEILKLLFTEDEARVALGLGFKPFPVDVIARRARLSKDKVSGHLEKLADKGLVFTKERDDGQHYGIVPMMPGIFEFPIMKADEGEFLDKLSDQWKAYMPKLCKGLGSPSMSVSRIIPIEEEVERVTGVLPYEKVYSMIDTAKTVGIGKCACRVYSKNCDGPIEACMVFDNMCDYLASRGIVRKITKDEMKQKLREFDKIGLVHVINNSLDRIDILCNCCSCCCALLKCFTTFDNPQALNKSGFIPECDSSKCTLCGICADERCPMDIIKLGDNELSIDLEKCIGCGLCVTGCPEEAMKLLRRENWIKPVEKTSDIGLTILKEKGKADKIRVFIDPDADPLSDNNQ